MNLTDGYGSLLLLSAGLFMIKLASKRGSREFIDRSGEVCNPDEMAPPGYQCGQTLQGWMLRHEPSHFVGFGSYLNRENIGAALNRLGFSDGNLIGFQRYMSIAYDESLRQDGFIDSGTIKALKKAEAMLDRGEWLFPREVG